MTAWCLHLRPLLPRCAAAWLLGSLAVAGLRSVLFAQPLDVQTLQNLRGGRAQDSTKDTKPAPKRRRFSPESYAERLLWTLGCELWSAGRDMTLAGGSVAKGEIGAAPAEFLSGPQATTSHLPTVLVQGGSALQDAGDALLDGAWRRAWRRLEVASQASQEYWPAAGFTGLIDLVFLAAEPITSTPERFRGKALLAAPSLEHVALGLDVAISSIDHNIQIQYPHREKAEALLISASDILRDATCLFDGGSLAGQGEFHLPRDPRSVGVHYHDDDDDFWEDDDDHDDLGSVYDPLEYVSGDMVATLRIRDIQKELIRADRAGDHAGRRKLLNRLVREYHPDQNPGKEEEVRPVFEYCLRMLRLCKDVT